MSDLAPRVSVVVATYRRPESLAVALKSILASAHDSFELILVDQNEEAVPGIEDLRLRILKAAPEGISAARNRGTEAARGELIAYTDDDCEVEADWLRSIEDAFLRWPEAGMVLGSVSAGRHDEGLGFIPACVRNEERIHRRFADCPEVEVMGASMGMPKRVWKEVGGFWEEIGAGRRIRAGEDYDIAVRTLESGYGVVECPGAVVVHHGFRAWPQGRELLEGYAFGTAYVAGYHLGKRPLELMRCLWRFWRSYRNRKSNIVQSAGRETGGRLLPFGRGLARGVADRWLGACRPERGVADIE